VSAGEEIAEALRLKALIEDCVGALTSPDDPRLRSRAILEARSKLEDALNGPVSSDHGVPTPGRAVAMPAGIAAWRALITTIDVLSGRGGDKRLSVSLGRETIELQLGREEARYLAGLLVADDKNADEALEAEAVGGAVTDDRPGGGEPAVAVDHDAEPLVDPVGEAPVGALQLRDDGLNDDGQIAQRGGLGIHGFSSGEGCDDATVRRVGGGGEAASAGEPPEPPSVPEDIQ